MKKIIIGLTDKQYEELESLINRTHQTDLENETLSGYALHLNHTPIDSWLEFESNGITDLGPVNWEIE
ncbi:hypothetical protein KIH41_02440 [Litoribacter ruber]|uniref:hypothetical protein n=1 Tax=Litoribacter ruber TaxID=702568 RepID=UPI001BD99C8C|nr:hypothetical protein [Litoribacter ruber]MBT0810139.1 hypothetical protein [Litoribacter ruber]